MNRRIFILDPCLQSTESHNYFAAKALYQEALSLEYSVKIFGHKKMSRKVRKIPSQRLFKKDGYFDPLLPQHAFVREIALTNGSILSSLHSKKFKSLNSNDFVFFPVITGGLILAACQWIAGFQEHEAPDFGMCLMFEKDWTADTSASQVTSLFYESAFRFIPQYLRRKIVYTCETQALGDQYEPMIEQKPVVLPIPTLKVEESFVPKSINLASPLISFLGYTKLEKGIGLLPEVLMTVKQHYPQARYLIQLMGWNKDLIASTREKLAFLGSNLEIIEGSVDAERMGAIHEATDLLLLPYDPASYGMRGSTLFSEARLSGTPVVAPRKCAIGENLGSVGAGSAFEEFNATSIAEATLEALVRIEELTEMAQSDAIEYKKETKRGYLKELIGTLDSRSA